MYRALQSGSSITRSYWHRSVALSNSAKYTELWAAGFASSSDDESTQRLQNKSDDEDQGRSDYRTWVESMLTSQRSDPSVRKDVAQRAETPEEPARGNVEGNLGLEPQPDLPEPSQELEHSATEAMPEEAVQSLAKADLETHSKAPKQTEDVRPLGDEAEQLKGALETFPDRQQPASPADAQQATPSLSEATPKEESNIPQVPRRLTMKEPAMVLPDAVLGYRELGIAESGEANAALLDDGQGRINRRRSFWPSSLYRPEDLVAGPQDRISRANAQREQRLKVKKATNAEALRQADFRNVSFLHKFTSEAGALPPRRVTRLQKKVHVHVMKQIKLARQMALLPPEGKLEELMPQPSGRAAR